MEKCIKIKFIELRTRLDVHDGAADGVGLMDKFLSWVTR